MITIIKQALENIKENYCNLSQIDYSKLYLSFEQNIKETKYLERPFAYEFYHEFRKLMENSDIDFGRYVMQAEVDKRYQHCFEDGKIPDFIMHKKNSNENLCVIEFKLATNLTKLKDDFDKLLDFKTNPELKYTYAVEVIIGDTTSLIEVKQKIEQLKNNIGEEIIVIEFNTSLWKAQESRIQYQKLLTI
ncbi:MAG: hypothetical protein WC614_13220 [bacterium]